MKIRTAVILAAASLAAALSVTLSGSAQAAPVGVCQTTATTSGGPYHSTITTTVTDCAGRTAHVVVTQTRGGVTVTLVDTQATPAPLGRSSYPR